MQEIRKNNYSNFIMLTCMIIVSIIILSAYLLLGAVSGYCERYTPLTEFDTAQFEGIWYELKRDNEAQFFSIGECNTWQFGTYDETTKSFPLEWNEFSTYFSSLECDDDDATEDAEDCD